MVANARGVGMYTEADGTAGNVAGNVLDVEAGDGAGVGACAAASVVFQKSRRQHSSRC